MSPEQNYQESDDSTLVSQTLEGHTKAFDELVRRHSRKLHSMLLQMVHNDADAYDIAQEAFLKAFHSLRYFSGKSAFYTWLYSISANHARNFLRKRKRENSYSLDNDDKGNQLEKDDRLADSSVESDPIRQASNKDLKIKLASAIETLSPNHREVVTLFDIQGLSYQEISDLLGISTGTLRSRLHYAHRQLQSILSEEYN